MEDNRPALVQAEMCSERDSPLKRLYRRTHAKLAARSHMSELTRGRFCFRVSTDGPRWAPQVSRVSSGWPGAGTTKGSRGLSLSLHISGSSYGLDPTSPSLNTLNFVVLKPEYSEMSQSCAKVRCRNNGTPQVPGIYMYYTIRIHAATSLGSALQK